MNSSAVIAISVALGISTLFGGVLTAWLLPPQIGRRFLWVGVLAPGIGAGLCSFIFLVFRRPMFTIELAILIGIAAMWVRRRSLPFTQLSLPSWRAAVLGLILLGGGGLALAGFMLRVDRMPHGNWDGWAIWNTHARFLYRDGTNWKTDILHSFHADYPLLAPSVTARFWRYAGEEVPEAGALLGIVLALSAVALLALTISELRGTSLGVLVALVLLGTPSYLDYATSQYADVPLSFFILATIVLILLHFERAPESGGLLVLGGFSAGCAGWTKNEGLLFILAACAGLLLPIVRTRPKTWHRFVSFASGLALPLIVILVFKFTVSPPSDIIASQYVTVEKILDSGRHALILKNAAATFWLFGQWSIAPMIPLFAFVALHGIQSRILRNTGWLCCLVIFGMVVAGYYFVYVVTPVPLQLHLDASLGRLFLHLWPSFLLLIALLSRPSKSLVSTHEA
jgi:hypothetical protein